MSTGSRKPGKAAIAGKRRIAGETDKARRQKPSPDDDTGLIARALEVRSRAWVPYSGFRVGAAILDDRGDVHVGCNVENASFPHGSCAETGAIAAMVAAGGRRIRRIAVAGGHDEPMPCPPCGGCRQRIAEFADADTRILVLEDGGGWRSYTLAELLPASFHL